MNQTTVHQEGPKGERSAAEAWHSLSRKTVWVVGGAGYLGSAIVEELDRTCEKVVCLDLPGRAAALVERENLSRTISDSFDVTDVAKIPAVIDALVAAHGLPDGIVYLAMASSQGRTVENLSAAEFQATFDRGLTPVFEFCRHLAEKMKGRGSGSFVLFSSMYGMVAPDPKIYLAPMTTNPIDYGASKAALMQLTRYFAIHYGPFNLRFNSVSPGPFPNPSVQRDHPDFVERLSQKTALGRIGQNTEMAGPVLFLLTDSASFVTGHNLVVDGGWTAW